MQVVLAKNYGRKYGKTVDLSSRLPQFTVTRCQREPNSMATVLLPLPYNWSKNICIKAHLLICIVVTMALRQKHYALNGPIKLKMDQVIRKT